MIAEGERAESMQANANILVIGIVSHKKEARLTTDVSKRDQKRVDVLKQAFKSVFTMTRDCDDTIYDRAHHVKHTIGEKGAVALIDHLDRQNATVEFDFICLEFVRMPGPYYTNFVTGEGRNPGAPLLAFVCRLRDGGKLSSGCKLLLASMGNEQDRWPRTKELLQREFGQPREVEANENPYYRACALAACCSERYNNVAEFENRNKNEKPFAEFTVLPNNALSSPLFKLTNPFSEDNDEESDRDRVLDTMLLNLINERGHEYSDFDSKTSTEDTLVAVSTANDRQGCQRRHRIGG